MTIVESSKHPFHSPVEEGKNLPITQGLRSAQLFNHGSMKVRFYSPKGVDEQTPHSQDEIYIILSGKGWFQNGEERHPFDSGDVIFAPAGLEHRFFDFSNDFANWVIFYGPEGGELP